MRVRCRSASLRRDGGGSDGVIEWGDRGDLCAGTDAFTIRPQATNAIAGEQDQQRPHEVREPAVVVRPDPRLEAHSRDIVVTLVGENRNPHQPIRTGERQFNRISAIDRQEAVQFTVRRSALGELGHLEGVHLVDISVLERQPLHLHAAPQECLGQPADQLEALLDRNRRVVLDLPDEVVAEIPDQELIVVSLNERNRTHVRHVALLSSKKIGRFNISYICVFVNSRRPHIPVKMPYFRCFVVFRGLTKKFISGYLGAQPRVGVHAMRNGGEDEVAKAKALFHEICGSVFNPGSLAQREVDVQVARDNLKRSEEWVAKALASMEAAHRALEEATLVRTDKREELFDGRIDAAYPVHLRPQYLDQLLLPLSQLPGIPEKLAENLKVLCDLRFVGDISTRPLQDLQKILHLQPEFAEKLRDCVRQHGEVPLDMGHGDWDTALRYCKPSSERAPQQLAPPNGS